MPVKIFFCYNHEDDTLRYEFEKHISALKHSGEITIWYDRNILPGTDWNHEINIHLNDSDIILLFISSDFIASEYCYGIETRRALERHNSGKARVIPIILRPVLWETTPIGHLQALPIDAKPITQWEDRDEAFKNVVIGIRRVIWMLLTQKEIEQLIDEANTYYYAGKYKKALQAYNDIFWHVHMRPGFSIITY